MKQHCETCPTIRDCKTAFGKYWGDKSHGGTGCDHPFKYDTTVGASRAETTKNRIMKQEKLI